MIVLHVVAVKDPVQMTSPVCRQDGDDRQRRHHHDDGGEALSLPCTHLLLLGGVSNGASLRDVIRSSFSPADHLLRCLHPLLLLPHSLSLSHAVCASESMEPSIRLLIVQLEQHAMISSSLSLSLSFQGVLMMVRSFCPPLPVHVCFITTVSGVRNGLRRYSISNACTKM